MSHYWNKSCKLITICLITFTSVMTVSYFQSRVNSSRPRPTVEFCKGIPTHESITPLKNNKTFIIAAYFDDRENEKKTRVIGITHHKDVKQLYCKFCCPSNDTIQISEAKIDVHSDRFGFPYGTFDLLCLEPKDCNPNFVTIHVSPGDTADQLPQFEIKNREAKDPLVEFTVCISTMFARYDNVLQFLQSVEMYKILGVGKVVIYKNSCSPLMEKVLNFYIAEGTVEVIPWPVDSYLKVSSHWRYSDDAKDLGYYGQITALNDCIYRNMHKSKYVLLNDIDEIILPVKDQNWNILMQNLQKQNPKSGVFIIENHIFPKTIFTPIDPVNISSWSAVPGINILEHVVREPPKPNTFNPTKMIVDPRKVIQTSVHSVLKAYGGSVYVSDKVALVYHCRDPLQPSLPRSALINDITLWRYNKSLVENVNKVIQQITL
ncbi:beta-1,4-galactosyltransferase galt-1-like isoform X5 [Hemicordylus capensis]|uniref:beta-1,4-galactosyltransferase galt-1-like isoform X5 n=1 Tax=Hemicordylus capensis TaxID=884348 RepID=UPI0023026DC8|nr:beta-1,4-galactosyltransferase galt-1-like isoform X5 [Hemicordylus capensis]XP_053137666.1 beta-1,4-galactosyltransferase galt-1-like isoform X5 [Hemicordylus capensis]